MATTKKLLVKTPQTVDGKNLAYDEDKKVIYSHSIVEPGAKRSFEALNTKLPSHLRHEFEMINVKEDGGKEDHRDAEIESLKKELADAKAKADADAKPKADKDKK